MFAIAPLMLHVRVPQKHNKNAVLQILITNSLMTMSFCLSVCLLVRLSPTSVMLVPKISAKDGQR